MYRFLLFFLLLGVGLSGQSNYQLFRPGVQYLFENPVYMPGQQRWIISTQYYGIKTDSLGCQPLYTSLWTTRETNCVKAVPSPFGFRICQGNDETKMDFGELGELTLRQVAGVGEDWVAGTVSDQTILAEVTAIRWEERDDLTDSVKYISFSVQGEPTTSPLVVEVSKRFGLLAAPRMYAFFEANETLQLRSLSDPEFGPQLPRQENLGQTEIGDVIHTHRTRFGSTSMPFNIETHTLRIHRVVDFALDTARNWETLVVEVDQLQYINTFGEPGSTRDSSLVRDTLFEVYTYLYDSASLYRAQPGEALRTNRGNNGAGYYRMLNAVDGPCGNIGLQALTEADGDLDSECLINSSALDANPDRISYALIPFTSWQQHGGPGPLSDQEVVYAKNKEFECGTPFDFSDIVISTRDFKPDERIRAFPNPTSGEIRLEVPAEYQNTRLTVFDALGSHIIERNLSGGAERFSAAGWKPGVYLLIIYADNQPVGRQRLIVR